MDSPITPLQRDKEIDRFVQALNLKWRLTLPTGNWSPSPGTNSQIDKEVEAQEKCIKCIRLLYFKDRTALKRVIESFEDVAGDSTPLDGWVFKPNQDQDTLPKRSTALGDSIPKQTDIPWPNRISLTQRLLKLLESEAEVLKARLKTSSKNVARVCTTTTTATTTAAIHDDSSALDPADRGAILNQGKELGSCSVTVANRHTKQVKLDRYFSSTTGPNKRRHLSNADALESISKSLGEDPSLNSKPSTKLYENVYPQLDVGTTAATVGVNLVAAEHTHPGASSSNLNEPSCLESTLHSLLENSRRASINEDDRNGKRKSRLFYGRQGHDTEDEEYFTTRESPPSPSVDYESRRQTKSRRRSGAESSLKKTQGCVPVSGHLFPSQELGETPMSLTHSRKRSSLDSAVPRHRKSPRPRPDERPHSLTKVNAYVTQDNRPMPLCQPIDLPEVPLLPPAPSANTSFSTSASTSFSTSIFSIAPGDVDATTSANTSFLSGLGGPSEYLHGQTAKDSSHSEGIGMALGADSTQIGGGGRAKLLGERGDGDVEMLPSADKIMPNSFRSLQGMSTRSPEQGNPSFIKSGDHIASSTEVSNAFNRAKVSPTVRGLEERLFNYSPFAQQMPTGLKRRPLRVRYEINRISLECGIPMSELATKLPSVISDYREMWSLLRKVVLSRGKNLPERSSDKAWALAGEQFDNVALTGELSFNNSKDNPLSSRREGPIFSFRLKPLKLESSCRLFRRFGGDRFIIISLPLVSSLPTSWKVDKKDFQEGVVNWLVRGSHEFLGREWKAFYLKMNRRKMNLVAGKDLDSRWLVYFFAVDGCDFVEGTKPPAKGEPVGRRSKMALREMLEWFMPFEPNKDKTGCKSFARLSLAVSQTRGTVVFRPDEIRRIPDTLNPSGDKAMNDGCARISRPAACAIAEMLCLDGNTPSAFQGRIAGAKGLWIVDPSKSPNSNTYGDRGYWIEITDSQWKFEGHPIDIHLPDDDRMTFEVNDWSRPLRVASLNFQLLPILECQGVPRRAIEKHLREGLEFKVSELMESIEDPVAFRKWVHENGDSIEERVKYQGVQFRGGFPAFTFEKINWFLESGFSVRTCAFLRELAKNETKRFCDRLKERMKIEVGQSTYAYCVADPLGVLEEGEVHFGFSGTFKDPRSGFQDTILHDIDVLVARYPAALPSDVQKVRAVFKPELRVLKDVIVFSTKGSIALAEKLSGGDYDGDGLEANKVWVCWDPGFVSGFGNASLPESKPISEQLEHYGITQDKSRLMDLPSDPNERTLQFVLRGFKANLEESLMGMCTNFHEAFCYHAQSIESPSAIALAMLLGLLVDREKQGYVFTMENWQCFRRKISRSIPPRPAFREGDESMQTKHIIDHMVFRVAKPAVDKFLTDFQQRFPNPPSQDSDLVKLWKQESEANKKNVKILQVLNHLVLDIEAVWNYWKSHWENRSEDVSDFPNHVWRAHARFNEILPIDVDHPLPSRWRQDAIGNPNSHWRLLRASAAFNKYPDRKFVWWVTGRELGLLKALASGGHHTVVTPIHASYIPDKSYVRRTRMNREQGMDVEAESVMGDKEIEGEEEDFGESLFGYDDWLDEAL